MRIRIGSEYFNNLRFVDDMFLLSASEENQEKLIKEFLKSLKAVLKMNMKKLR